ncbi:MAG: carboxypeptidase-like regulatory domain-containing protein, partial [Ignavibacteria bacterium]|nr:carboxypeptidase-like regulatory domain-containing protein [Ignavibacteria bacterium]
MKKNKKFFSWVDIIPWERTFRIMKIFLILLTTTFVSFATGSYSQSKSLTFRLEKVNLIQIFEEIEKQSDTKIAYDVSCINMDQRMNISVDETSIENVLNKVLENTDLSYRFINRYVIIFKKDSDQPTNVQQQKPISGKVVDSSGSELPGVSVVIKGTTSGVITDADGKFFLANIPSDATLVFSFVGMKSEEIKVGSKSVINVILEEETIGIEEVVAIGYGTQRKGDVTSAITSIKAEDFSSGKIGDAAELVKGKIAGLSITKSSGDPNATSSVMLRGITTILGSVQPLVLVDGIEGSLTTVAPENIASIDVLKDASAAAIYGTRGANGVILITTKSGKHNTPTRTTYSNYASLSEWYRKADFMDTHDIIYGRTNFNYEGFDTDWLKAVTRKAGYTQNHSLGLEGGSENSTYAANITFSDE